MAGCGRAARAGGHKLCAAHGGGLRCQVAGCQKARASGGRPFCILHGGGRRCAHEGCEKSASSRGLPFWESDDAGASDDGAWDLVKGCLFAI